ncbi:hypothetical protein HMPREF3185_01526 [Porphyromonas somerae]|uniref:Uncharacterized protein n=1 Tax=Porphyromonas somerae TaxID=322095 RepID=A0A134B5K0_9PORP|nr:hypothetical protein HMPREF3184_01526 [Porphyromonadaceae bacterium KA00676]KXB75222.1 hypothetical protein HMPREF3185_01526 [Porphyromonas somerae]
MRPALNAPHSSPPHGSSATLMGERAIRPLPRREGEKRPSP